MYTHARLIHRMPKLLALLVISTMSGSSVANERPSLPDSLHHEWALAPTNGERALIAMQLSKAYMNTSSDSAQYYISTAIDVAKNEAPSLRMRLYANGAKIARVRADFDLGVRYAQEGLLLAQQMQDSVRIMSFQNCLGGIYHYLGDYPKALTHFLSMKEMLADCPQEDYERSVYNNLAHIYRLTGRTQEAMEHYKRVKELCAKRSKPCCAVSGDLGKTFFAMEQYEQAMYHHQQHIKCMQTHNPDNINGFSSAYIDIADAHLRMQEPQQAIAYSAKGLALATEFGNYLHMREHAYNLAQAHEAMQRFDSAYYYHQLFVQVKDSIMNERSAKTIAELEVKYETSQKESALAQAQQAIRIKDLKRVHERKTAILLGGIALLMLALFAVAAQLRGYRMQQKNRALGKRLLRAQMNPHFLFNTLMAVKGFLYKGDIPTIDRYLFQLASLMRSTLEGTRLEYVSLQAEQKSWHDYLELQQLRFGQRFEFHITSEVAVEKEHVLVPPMLVQPLLENAVEHGIRHLPDERPGLISITVTSHETSLSICVEDNGLGIGTPKKPKHRSMGTQIILDRLALLNGKRKGRATLMLTPKQVNGKASGTEAVLQLPFIESFNNINTTHPI